MVALLTLSALFTSVLSAVVGMAGGMVLLSIMTFFMPLNIIIPVHGLVQLTSNSSRTWLLRHKVIKPVLMFFLLGLPLGGLTATYLIKEVESKVVPLSLIVLLIFYTLFKPKKIPSINFPSWGFIFIGYIVGLLGPLIGATGPFIAPFFLKKEWTKEQIVATKASVQSFGHLLKIPIFLYTGFAYGEYALPIILMMVATLIGTRIGVHILGTLQDKIFRWIYKTALFIAALRLIYKIYHLL